MGGACPKNVQVVQSPGCAGLVQVGKDKESISQVEKIE
jgi:hypothetical protein